MLFYNNKWLTREQQVEENRENIEDLQAEIKEKTFYPKGIYSASEKYNYRDSVMFTDSKVYVHISKTETQGVPPTDESTWAVLFITEQGPKGDRGEAGNDSMIYSGPININEQSAPPQLSDLDLQYFSAVPKVDDYFICTFYLVPKNERYFAFCKISSKTADKAVATVETSMPISGVGVQGISISEVI